MINAGRRSPGEPLMPSRSIHARVFAGGVFAAALLFAAAGYGQSGPFSSLAGAWSGSGTLAFSKGSKERIRCRAKYAVASAGSNLALELRCASDSYKFELQADMVSQNDEVQVNWNETTRRVAGRVAGTVAGNRINVRVDSPQFAALLTLTTSGDRQSISIKGPPGAEMSEAAITLNR